MKALLDADILLYEVGFAAEAFWKYYCAENEKEVEGPPPWEVVESILSTRIPFIVSESGAEGAPFLFFSGRNNFRNHLAVTQPYKDRDGNKPFHYYNIKAFLKSEYTYQEEDWLEADDLIGIAMSKYPGKYICLSRDKDLKQLPGHHYGWEVGKQPSFGPELVDDFGWLMLSSRRDKCIGTGSKFFHYQMLVGDDVDTIPGVPGYGPVKAFKTLDACNTIDELEQAVVGAYKALYGLDWLDRMRETGRLINMVREREDEYVLLYNPSFVEKKEWMNIRSGEIVDAR